MYDLHYFPADRVAVGDDDQGVDVHSWPKRLLLLAILLLAGMTTGAASASADPTFGVMNASGGIYWRSSPDWTTAEAVAGNGFYPDTVIAVHCYQSGAANVPGSSDSMWEQASVVGGSGTGSGWINEHFINDGQPINQPSPGVPSCSAAPPAPGPSPTPAPLPPGEFAVQNASGGIYWRFGPDWSTAEAVAGNGFYPDTIIRVSCYQSGAANVPGSNDGMWEEASIASGSGTGTGWINEHFINDGQPINQPSPGVSPCAVGQPPPGGSQPPTTGGGGQPSPASIYFSPYGSDSHRLRDQSVKTVYVGDVKTGCSNTAPSYRAALATAGGSPISTLAGWSLGRVGVMKFLTHATSNQLKSIGYILLIDPGDYDELSCDRQLQAGSLLVQWLSTNPTAHLVVISGSEDSQLHGSSGIQQSYFNAVRTGGDGLRSRVLTCNYTISHQDAFVAAQYWIKHLIGSTTHSCPWLVKDSTTHKPTAQWHP